MQVILEQIFTFSGSTMTTWDVVGCRHVSCRLAWYALSNWCEV